MCWNLENGYWFWNETKNYFIFVGDYNLEYECFYFYVLFFVVTHCER